MRRAERLFEIIQVLRRAKGPMTGRAIADALEMSRRTLYRDIAALVARRVPIRGEAGVGYVLERGFDMPPLMLTANEVEAVVLGAQWVVANGDTRGALPRAAGRASTPVAGLDRSRATWCPPTRRALLHGLMTPGTRRPTGSSTRARFRGHRSSSPSSASPEVREIWSSL